LSFSASSILFGSPNHAQFLWVPLLYISIGTSEYFILPQKALQVALKSSEASCANIMDFKIIRVGALAARKFALYAAANRWIAPQAQLSFPG